MEWPAEFTSRPDSTVHLSIYRWRGSQRRYDWRVIVNGRLDHALYEAGRSDGSLPFEKLRRVANMGVTAETAPEEEVGDDLRNEIERNRRGR
jgi:hypothetical protein